MTESTTSDVCKEDDEFVRNKPRWVAVLSNGETIYQDDGRPGLAEPSAWLRLRAYCQERRLHIVEFWLQFRSNRILVEPRNADGYYFVNAVFAVWGEECTYHAFVVGALVDGRVRGVMWMTPALIPIDTIDRDPDEKPQLLIAK